MTGPASTRDDAGSTAKAVLTMLGRAYCSLCDAMQRELEPIAERHALALQVIDIDAHPAWAERWGDLVPVVFLGDPETGTELGHYRLDHERTERALRLSAGRQRPTRGENPLKSGG